MMPSGSVDWAALGLWLLVTELLELFFLSLGALCAMATGWLLAIPVLYGAANCIVLLVCVVVQFLQRWFYFGFESTTFPMAVILADAHRPACPPPFAATPTFWCRGRGRRSISASCRRAA